jgi:hypothetical protein
LEVTDRALSKPPKGGPVKHHFLDSSDLKQHLLTAGPEDAKIGFYGAAAGFGLAAPGLRRNHH